MESINGNGESRLDRIERLLEIAQVRNEEARVRNDEEWARQKEAWAQQDAGWASNDEAWERNKEASKESRARNDEAWERHPEALEDFEREHKRLLIAQVVMADAAAKSDLKLAELTVKLNGLIGVIDGQIREKGTH